jgi:hypothetical protein
MRRTIGSSKRRVTSLTALLIVYGHPRLHGQIRVRS